MIDEYTKMLRSIDDLLRPHLAFQRELDRLLKPQIDVLRHVSGSLSATAHVRDYMDHIDKSALKAQQGYVCSLSAQAALESQVQRALASSFFAEEALDTLVRAREPWWLDQISELAKSQDKMLASVRTQLDSLTRISDQVAGVVDPFKDYLADLHVLAIDVDASGNVVIEGEEISAGDIAAATGTFEGARGTLAEFLQSLVDWLGRLSPRLRAAVLAVLLPYVVSILANLTTPLFQTWWAELGDGADRRVVKKEIIAAAHELFAREELAHYRFVYASRLHVRAAGADRADIIDTLVLGKSVRVVQRNKAWTEVEYLDDVSGELRTGWVSSRYLHKFVR